MSDEFHGLDATEKAGFEVALNRCRPLAAQIASELRNKRPEHFVDKLALADLCAFRRNTYSRGEGFGAAAQSVIIEGDLRISCSRGQRADFCWSSHG
jgi:hypothetical protein